MVKTAYMKNLGLNFQYVASEILNKIDRDLNDAYNILQMWTQLDIMQGVTTNDEKAEINTFLNGWAKEVGNFYSIDVINDNGVVIASLILIR